MMMNLDNSMSRGGFMNDSISESANNEGGNAQNRAQNIVPVMVKHITESPGEEMQLWGIRVRIITFVGIVRHIEESTTKISYQVEDETGTVTALKWLEANKSAPEPTVEVDTYIRVTGLVRPQPDKHVLILRAWPIEDLNELTTHMLEVTYAALKAEKFALQNGDAAEISVKASANDSVQQDNYYGMTKEQAVVYNIVQAENHTECGIEKSDVKARVPKHILPQTDEILEFLVCEGHIYTTRTEDHFKTT